MISAYITGVPSYYEGEDIELRYAIYDEETLLTKEMIAVHYKKPSVVGATAFLRGLKALSEFKNKEITIVINDSALCEFISGTGNTKDKDVQRLVREIQSELTKFDQVTIKNAGLDFKELTKWKEVLHA